MSGGVLGIEGYEPRGITTPSTLAAVHRARFARLIGQPLVGAWLMWDLDEHGWFADGPVVLGFGDANVEITHRKFDECAITWDQIDMQAPLDWPGLRLDWRADPHPAILAAATGRRLTRGQRDRADHAAALAAHVLHAVEFLFERRAAGDLQRDGRERPDRRAPRSTCRSASGAASRSPRVYR